MFKKKPLTTRVYRYYRDHQSEVTGVVKPLSRATKPVSQVILSVLSKLPISLPHRHDPAWKRTIKHWRRRRRIVVAVAAAFILLVLPTIYLTLRNPKETEAAPWATTAGSWTKRKQVTLTNNSGQTFEANTTYAVNINTQELVSAGYLNSDCSDLRIYYQPDESTTTKLAYYFDTAAGATNCSDSTSTKVYFPLQANLSNSSSTGAYYIYYGNTDAASEASVDAFDIGSTQALMVCPFNGDTECINGDGAESPTTETGAIRYGGSKSAVTFDGTGTDYINLGSPTALDDMISGKKITFESWVKVDKIGCHQYWTSTNFGGSGGGWWAYWGCSVAPTGNFTIQCNTQDASSTPTTALPTGEWFHYAATYDDTGDQKVHIFVNGTEVSYTTQNACTGGVISDASQSKYIWHDEWSSGSKAVGEVDEFRISDVIRYSSNFTPQTEPFIRDEHTKLLLHFDENGGDPRNTGKAIDDSGNGNHGTITGAKYVAGLVGVDASTSDSGNVPSQSYADHSGVFIEEGTTNLVTNPSFENGNYNTGWSSSAGSPTSTGPNSPATIVNDATVGSSSWNNSSNATASDDVYASVSGLAGASNYLKATNFGFSIPSGSVINGIVVDIERKGGGNGPNDYIVDNEVKIVKPDGTIGSTDKKSGSYWTSTESYATYGSSSDLWGETWTSDGINDADFGVVLSAVNPSPDYGTSPYVDHFRVTIYYSPPAITATQNSSSPYYRFGLSSAKLVPTTDASYTASIDPNSTAWHTLSAYVYNGTSGAVGGTVDNTVAQLVWEGTAQSGTTYTDMGGGWWRLTYAAATTDASNEYGIYVLDTKTVYIDGVQLEQTTYPTTYTDGSLGTGYSWSGTANASTSSRTTETLSYTTTSNINNSAGTIALWYKPNWSTGNSPSYDYIISNSYHADDHLILQYRDVDDKFVFSKNDGVTVTQNVVKDHWYYVVAAWDASNVYLSINGSAFTSSAMTASNLPSTFTIGNKVNWTGIDAGITVSDLVTYNNKLTDTQVADLYYSGLGSHQVQSDYTERFSGTEAPVLTWHLDEGYGTTAHDTTIKGNDGTISGAVWASDTYASPKQGKSLQFDGSNDYVYRTYSSDGELDPGTLPFSVSTWFKSPSSTGAQRNLISRYNSSGYKLYMNTSGNICFAVDDDSTWNPDDSTCTAASLADSKWHLVTAVRNTSTISVFIDGVQAASTATTVTGHLSGSAPTLYVGIDSDGTSNPWSGFIDEVRVYNHALTTAEILAEVSARGSVKGVSTAYATEANQGSLAQGLLGYWKMNESSGNVSDSSGNGLTLTNNGTTTFVTGKFANGSEHVPASSQYFSAGSTVSGVKSVSFWVNPDNTTNYYVDLNGTAYIQSSTGTISATGFTNPVIYVNGAISSTIAANTWSFVTISSDTAISATAFTIGKVSTNYFDGTLDEVRVYNRALSPAEVLALYKYAPGPVAEYKFDEGTGQSAYDSSGNNNTGTLGATGGSESSDPTWAQGKFGKALSFDGTDDSASVASFTPANSGTIGLWVKPDVVVDRLVGSNGNFEIRVNAGQIQADIFESTAGVPWTSNISTNTWTYLTVTWDNSGTFTRKLYFNGVLEVTNTNPQDSVSTTDLSFGTTTGSGEYFDGTLDNVKIYNYVRTPQQIVEDMNAGHPAPGSPIGSAYVHYKFDEMQGSTANNSGSSGSSKNGSITSGTWTNSGKQSSALTLTASSSITATISSPGTTNTFALWVYPTTSAASKTIVSDGTDTLATDSSSRPTYGGCTGTAISTDTWTHIIAVSNGSGSCSIYQNGALTASSTTGVDFGTALNIGASSFVGSIDDFKLYTVAMTADQAKTESNQGKAAVLGALSTTAAGAASWSSDRAYCPPGDTTATCGPVAEYKFDEKVVGDAQTIIDTSGNGYTATTDDGANNTGMSCATPGKYGASCTFDAVDDLITSTNVAYKSNSTGTVTAWFKNLTSTDSDVIFWLGDKDVTNTYFSIELRTSNVIRISNQLSGTWEFIKETGTNAYSLGVWNHLAIVQNGTAPKMYLNGKEMTLSDVSAPASEGAWFSALAAIDRMSIGAAGFNTPNAYFDGPIDQVKVFNYAFTPEQVAWDYSQGKPLAYYKFDECTGATLHSSNETYDSNLNATWTGSSGTQTSVGDCSTGGTAWGNGATGKSNGSLNFDGTDDKVQVVQPMTQARFSYSFWMKPSSLPGSSAYVVSEGFSYTNTNYILLNSAGNLDFRIFASQIATSNGPITTGNWYHVVGTYDGTNGKLYINGQLVKTAAATKGNSPDRFSIGGGTSGTGFFTGQIDEVKVYSYALSQQQILTDYNAGAVNYAN